MVKVYEKPEDGAVSLKIEIVESVCVLGLWHWTAFILKQNVNVTRQVDLIDSDENEMTICCSFQVIDHLSQICRFDGGYWKEQSYKIK